MAKKPDPKKGTGKNLRLRSETQRSFQEKNYCKE
jgi:hypothetical protein